MVDLEVEEALLREGASEVHRGEAASAHLEEVLRPEAASVRRVVEEGMVGRLREGKLLAKVEQELMICQLIMLDLLIPFHRFQQSGPPSGG